MKRSNRLVLLIGIFLAIVAFVLSSCSLNGGGGRATATPAPHRRPPIVVAAQDIDLGATIQADDVRDDEIAVDGRPADGFS